MRKRLTLVMALASALGTEGNAAACGAGSVVWKPAPIPVERGAELLPDDCAAATAALAAGLPLVAVVEALETEDVRLLLRRRKLLPAKDESGDTEPEGRLCAIRVEQERETGKWKFVFARGGEMVIDPDATTWAYWNKPGGYDHDFFETHWLNNGYSAVWVGCCHRVSYTPAPAAAPVGGVAPARHSRASDATATAVLAPAAIVPAATPAFSLSCPISPMPVIALAAEAESARVIPEPTSTVLSILALSALLARRRVPFSD